jgi:hypothetical protein
MKDENLVKLYTNHPRVFAREVAPECADGWFDLIDTACRLIEARLKLNPDVIFNLHQIKEKFGVMAFYYSGGDEYIRGVVNYAIDMSGKLCEISGDVGSMHETSNGWIRTVSDRMAEEIGMRPCRSGW